MYKIAFIGLGNMGSGMCANLTKQLSLDAFQVTAFDLNSEAVTAAAAAGAVPGTSIADSVKDADCVITMLPAGAHVASVYFDTGGITQSAPTSALLVDCSTIAVSEAREISNKASDLGFVSLDAPVSGGVAAANAGTLTFMVGGDNADFLRAQTIFQAMGKNIFHAGPSGNGQAAKTANNMLLGISMIATSEAFTLAEKLGLDAQTFFDIASNASGQCWSMTSYCPAPGPVAAAPSNNDYQAGFAVAMMLKDLRLAADAAASCRTATPFGAKAESTYAALADAGMADRDFSIIMQHLDIGDSA